MHKTSLSGRKAEKQAVFSSATTLSSCTKTRTKVQGALGDQARTQKVDIQFHIDSQFAPPDRFLDLILTCSVSKRMSRPISLQGADVVRTYRRGDGRAVGLA